MKIGVLTGGGDCPGLNAVIRAVVRKGAFHYGDEFVGFLEGWRGLLEDKTMILDLAAVGGILPRGGTILRTSRTNPAKHLDGLQRCAEALKNKGCDALIAIGGDDTLSVAQKLFTNGVRVAGGADVILIPEVPFDIDEVAELIRLRHSRGRYFSIVVAAEGAKFAGGEQTHDGASVVQEGRDEFGHARLGGIGSLLAHEIEKRTGFESRSVVLGHIQRGGSPSAFDRVLATRYGLGAIDMVHRGEYGQMAALRGNKIISIPLAEAIASNRKVDKEILDAATGILERIEEKTAGD